MNKSISLLASSVVLALGSMQVALAHTSLDVKEATAGTRFIAAFNIGHGCGVEDEPNVDTYKLVVDIPTELSVAIAEDKASNTAAFVPGIRPLDEAWGTAEVIENDEGVVTQVSWTKPANAEDRHDDTYMYQARVRLVLPNKPFTTIKFPAATQYCKHHDDEELSKAWKDEVVDGKDVLNAPRLAILPARKPGWNEFTAPRDLTEAEMKLYFANAIIVWVGDQAFSTNTITAAAITNKLTSIPSGAKIMAKY